MLQAFKIGLAKERVNKCKVEMSLQKYGMRLKFTAMEAFLQYKENRVETGKSKAIAHEHYSGLYQGKVLYCLDWYAQRTKRRRTLLTKANSN